ncbi:mitochondrial import receptor subunit tom-22 [Zalerion maritima]|uniref:Mitochondrial import receptor subunit tom-22 n=1 Tax=Zalerion maritima TaxID=339359 RepID=A0AAD5RPA2_9PEZI|nr:mitochondrial import receptor subunit tom-22 [Zalerion maritima]
MVQLTEVEDDHFKEQALKSSLENDDDFTDTDSEISSDSEYDPRSESLIDRLSALKDIIPPTARSYVASKLSTTHSAVASVLSFSGKTLWVLTSSALLFAVPFALATAEDQQIGAMEQEAKMREMGGDLMMGGGEGGQGQGGGKDGMTAAQVSAALGGQDGKAAL